MQNIPEKEEFRKYLEKSGVVDALTNVLVSLYEEPEKPADALDFVRKQLGSIVGVDIDGLKKENEHLQARVKELTAQVEELSKKSASDDKPKDDPAQPAGQQPSADADKK